jgi:hypothetical protein
VSGLDRLSGVHHTALAMFACVALCVCVCVFSSRRTPGCLCMPRALHRQQPQQHVSSAMAGCLLRRALGVAVCRSRGPSCLHEPPYGAVAARHGSVPHCPSLASASNQPRSLAAALRTARELVGHVRRGASLRVCLRQQRRAPACRAQRAAKHACTDYHCACVLPGVHTVRECVCVCLWWGVLSTCNCTACCCAWVC